MADEIDPLVVLDDPGAETVSRLLEEEPGPNEPMRELFARPCHCVHENGIKIAWGIDCFRTVGLELMREEDFHDGAPWAEPSWCTCTSAERPLL